MEQAQKLWLEAGRVDDLSPEARDPPQPVAEKGRAGSLIMPNSGFGDTGLLQRPGREGQLA